MNIQKTCCVTGHRKILKEKLEEIQKALAHEIQTAISDGYTHFIMGGAEGADLLFAQLVLEAQSKEPQITLEAALPYPERKNNPDPVLQNVLSQCNEITTLSTAYHKGCFHIRNRYMVEKASRILAVYDGRESGGTAYTLQYALSFGKEVRVI